MNKHDLIGLKVANDGSGLRKALEAHYQIESLTHEGNFMFRAKLADGGVLLICTESVDLAQRTIRITGIYPLGGEADYEGRDEDEAAEKTEALDVEAFSDLTF